MTPVRRLRQAGARYGLTGSILLIFLAVQAVRLVWIVLVPLNHRDVLVISPEPPSLDERIAQFRAYDPFFPEAVVTGSATVGSALAIRLIGVSVNGAAGTGSAFVVMPDGQQASFGAGEEIAPGATLKLVAIDHIVVNHDGRDEMIYLDQPAPPAADAGPGNAAQAR